MRGRNIGGKSKVQSSCQVSRELYCSGRRSFHAVGKLLPATGATSKIIPGHVVLILEKEDDALLWNAIKGVLGDQGLGLDQISKISSEYTNADDRIYLKLNSVDIRESGATVMLGDDVRVWL